MYVCVCERHSAGWRPQANPSSSSEQGAHCYLGSPEEPWDLVSNLCSAAWCDLGHKSCTFSLALDCFIQKVATITSASKLKRESSRKFLEPTSVGSMPNCSKNCLVLYSLPVRVSGQKASMENPGASILGWMTGAKGYTFSLKWKNNGV